MGRTSNNGTSTIKTLSHTTNSTNLPLDQIHPFTTSTTMKPSNQILNSDNNYPENLSNNNTLITTTNVILDYLLFLSINARIDQSKTDLKNDHYHQFSSFHTKKGQGVEAIVEGLLQSHRTQASSMLLPLPLKHRLYLCQLLHLVFDRSHFVASSYSQVTQNLSNTQNTSKSPNLSKSTTNTTTITTSTTSPRNNINNNNNNINTPQKSNKLPTNLVKYEKHFKNALLSRCRKHRQSICTACQQHPSNSSITPPMTRRRSTPPKPIPTRRTTPGLIDAIPVFLNTCAITYRLANDNESMSVKPIWYDLLLDLLTQAAIECYLCDSYSSIDSLLEIFSYGNIDPSDYHSDDSDSDDDDPHFAATRADDYLLWQRTAYLDEFRQKKKERMEEFLNVKGKLEQHFENLANKYPVRNFETEMLKYCAGITSSLEPPALMTEHKINKNNEELSELFHIPGRYDGGIDIPMSDEDIDDINYKRPSQSENNNEDVKKRRLSECDKSKEMIKKTKSEEVPSFQ